jgi:hypothetical protein
LDLPACEVIVPSGHIERVQIDYPADSVFWHLKEVLRELRCEISREDVTVRALTAEQTSTRGWFWGLLLLPFGLIRQPHSIAIAARVDAAGDSQSFLTIEVRQLYGQPAIVGSYRQPAAAILEALAGRLRSTPPRQDARG